MTNNGDYNTRNLLQYIIFAFLLIIALSHILLKLWLSAASRERPNRTSCCKGCSDLFTRRVHYDEADLRTLRELEQPPHREAVGINGAYRMYQARRCRLSLRLATWREDVKQGGGEEKRLHHKLAQIQMAQSLSQHTQSGPSALADQTSLASTIPSDDSVIEITDRVDEFLRLSVAATSSHASSLSFDLDLDSAYKLVLPTPKNEKRDLVRTDRRSAVIVEEEEEKEDGVVRDIEAV